MNSSAADGTRSSVPTKSMIRKVAKIWWDENVGVVGTVLAVIGALEIALVVGFVAMLWTQSRSSSLALDTFGASLLGLFILSIVGLVGWGILKALEAIVDSVIQAIETAKRFP